MQILFRLGLAVMLAGLTGSGWAEGEPKSVWIKSGSYAEVRESVEMAITGRGFVVNNVSHVGEMLDRTGKEVGSSKKIFLHAEALEFCSATVSRKMMEADPGNIVFCPYIISIYELPERPNEVRVAYRRVPESGTPASRKALNAVNELLADIIKEAVQ